MSFQVAACTDNAMNIKSYGIGCLKRKVIIQMLRFFKKHDMYSLKKIILTEN